MTDDFNTPLFSDLEAPTAPAPVSAPTASRPPKHKLPAQPQNIAWTRDVFPTLPPHLRRAIYLQIIEEIKAGRLRGWILREKPLKVKVPIPGNGTRTRTFKHVVLRVADAGQRQAVQRQLDTLYADVRKKHYSENGVQHLTLKEALALID